MKAFSTTLAALAAIVLAAAPARAALRDEPFDYRLLLAFDRLTAFTDVTARAGASDAHPLGSSVNPASEDYLREKPYAYTFLGTASSNSIFTGSGAYIQGDSATWHYRLPTATTFYGAYIRTDMVRGDSRQGDDYGLSNNEFMVGVSHRFSDQLSVGIESHITDSYLSIRAPVLFGLQDRSVQAVGGNFVLGALYVPVKQWSFGISGGTGWTGADNRLSIALPAAPPANISFSKLDVSDTILNSDLRTGIGFRPTEQWGFYMDGQWRHLESKIGTADVGRLYAGAEFFPVPYVALRGGSSIDTAGKSNVAAGIGFYAWDPFIFEIAYAYNNFPEVEKEFGRAHVVSFSIVWKN